MALEYRLADAVHRLGQLGVRHMVGEAPVGVEIAAAGRVRAERGEHALGEKAARAVSGVHNDMLARERLFVPVRRSDDLFAQNGGIGLHKFAPRHAPAGGKRRLLRGEAEDLAHVRALRAARGGEEFESVAVPRQMARRDHNGGVKGSLPRHGRHEHRRGSAETEIGHFRAAGGKRFAKRCGDRFARKTRVAPDAHAAALFPEPRAQKARKAAASSSVTGSFSTPASATPRTSLPFCSLLRSIFRSSRKKYYRVHFTAPHGSLQVRPDCICAVAVVW